MSMKENDAIDVDFLIEARDLFRASIDMAKYRLLLGLGISLAFVTGLIMFFVVINEKVILIQTSPLFIGLPLVAIGGQVLRIHAKCRKYISSLSSSQKRMRYHFSVNAENYEVASGESRSCISWSDVLKIAERTRYFLIFLNKFDVQLIPKKAIQPAEQAVRLRGIFIAKLGARAKLRA